MFASYLICGGESHIRIILVEHIDTNCIEWFLSAGAGRNMGIAVDTDSHVGEVFDYH
jgi:hypothetical protein